MRHIYHDPQLQNPRYSLAVKNYPVPQAPTGAPHLTGVDNSRRTCRLFADTMVWALAELLDHLNYLDCFVHSRNNQHLCVDITPSRLKFKHLRAGARWLPYDINPRS
jgi:hypothetical protein